MVLTKELIAKGSAILGSAGAGGTGLYYGGGYLFGDHFQKGSEMTDYLSKIDSNIVFDVKTVEDGNVEKDIGENNTISFKDNKSSIKVKVTPQKLTTETLSTATTNTQVASDVLKQWTCSFRFEVEGSDYSNKTIKQDH